MNNHIQEQQQCDRKLTQRQRKVTRISLMIAIRRDGSDGAPTPLPFPTGGDKTTSALVKAKQFASGGVLRRRVPVVPRSAVVCEQRCRAAWPMRSRSCQSNEQPLGHVIASGSAPRPASPPPRRRRRRGGAIEGPPSPASSTTIDVNSGDDVSLDIFLRYVH